MLTSPDENGNSYQRRDMALQELTDAVFAHRDLLAVFRTPKNSSCLRFWLRNLLGPAQLRVHVFDVLCGEELENPIGRKLFQSGHHSFSQRPSSLRPASRRPLQSVAR